MLRQYIRHAYRTLYPLLFARQQYKLFLRTTLDTIDLRMHALASQTDYLSNFVQPIPITAPFGESVLAVAPHQDDEAIGCGGALALQLQAGKKAHVVMIYDGGEGHQDVGLSRSALSDIRNEESRHAAAVLGLDPPTFFNCIDPRQDLATNVQKLAAILTERKVDAVFTPYILDGHPDHRTTNYLLAQALKTVSWPVRVFGYEVWGLTIPTVGVIIDPVMERKVEMLKCFAFANQALDYVHTTKGLNMYRSRLFSSAHCQYVECFFELPRQEFIEVVEKIYAAEHSLR